MRKIVTKKNAILLLTVLSAVQLILISLLWVHQSKLKEDNTQSYNVLQKNIVSANDGLAYQQVMVSPADKKIYLPQLNLSLPITTLGTALLYSPSTAYDAASNTGMTGTVDEAAISIFGTAGAPQSQSRFDCSSLVRLRFESKPNPYNPNEIPKGSVALANGKTLQIYANHLKDCQLEYNITHAKADDIAALFTQAESY